MINLIKYIAIFITIIACTAMLWGQDDSQAELRENPDIESSKKTLYVAPKIEIPAYVNIDANHIEMNGADWSELTSLIDSACHARVNIVHIGDSHLQADMATSVSRIRLGEHYGYAGRALIAPFKLAGTNEPVDYVIKTDVPVEQSRLLKTPWPTAMGFTGVAVRPLQKEFEFTISAQQPFDSVAIFYTGDSLRVLNDCRYHVGEGITAITLDDTCSSLSLKLLAQKTVDIHGFNLLNGKSGVAYHVIGNNGATYGTYNGVTNFARNIAALEPSLIIISLGTNEAFGKMTDNDMKKQMNTLISGLKAACPNAQFLLTTPSECQRRIRRGKGRKRRTTGFAVNSNVKRLRNAIIDYSRAEGIPVYDFYAVAGGDGSSNKWLRGGLMNKDRIHLLRPGYTLQGHLFTDALEETFEAYRNRNL